MSTRRGVKGATVDKDFTVRVGVTSEVSATSVARMAEQVRKAVTSLHPDSLPRRRDRFWGRVKMAWRRRWWR